MVTAPKADPQLWDIIKPGGKNQRKKKKKKTEEECKLIFRCRTNIGLVKDNIIMSTITEDVLILL